MRRQGHTDLCPDPCAYIWHIGNKFATITVWVDNLLLVAATTSLINAIK